VALVVADPQIDFLSEGLGVVGESVQRNKTMENIGKLFRAARPKISLWPSRALLLSDRPWLEVRGRTRKAHACNRHVTKVRCVGWIRNSSKTARPSLHRRTKSAADSNDQVAAA
jgi:hypothetical protein